MVEVSCNAAGITTSTNVNVNCLPEPSSLQLTLAEDTPQHVQLNTSDLDNDTLTVEMKVEPSHGTLSSTSQETIAPVDMTYNPELNYFGTDRFEVLYRDAYGGVSTGMVEIVVTPVNDAPVLGDQQDVNLDEGQNSALAIGFSDVDNPFPQISCSGSLPAGATLSQGNGTLSVNYNPDFGVVAHNGGSLTNSLGSSVSCSDGLLNDVRTFNFNVADVNRRGLL